LIDACQASLQITELFEKANEKFVRIWS